MVKLASARESRLYGPHNDRNRWEYINSGLYLLAVFLLFAGFMAQLPGVSKGGLVVVLIGLAVVAAINLHDLFAHLAGIGYRIGMVQYDIQLGLVELLVPFLQSIGSVVTFIGVVLLINQLNTGYEDKLRRHATNCLIAGPLMWVFGSIHNGCQIYERADSRTQILQTSVHVPFLMGSLLFFVGGFFNRRHAYADVDQQGSRIVANSWAWLCMFGSLLLLIGGLFNILKVRKMQRDGLRLEKLHGGAQERLSHIREGRNPLPVEQSSATMFPTVGLKPAAAPVGPVPVSVPSVHSP